MNLPVESISKIMSTWVPNNNCKILEKYPKLQQKRKHFVGETGDKDVTITKKRLQ